MDPNLKNWIRPPWVELVQLQRAQDFDDVAFRFFGYKPPKDPRVPSARDPYRADEFQARLGIDISKYVGFYAEVGSTPAPTGPVTPATKRLPIKPILTIRQTNTGRFVIEGRKMDSGFYNHKIKRAWVRVDDYENMLGDTYFQEIEEESDRIMQQAAAKMSSQSDSKIHVIPLSGRDISPEEEALLKQEYKKAMAEKAK